MVSFVNSTVVLLPWHSGGISISYLLTYLYECAQTDRREGGRTQVGGRAGGRAGAHGQTGGRIGRQGDRTSHGLHLH